MIDLFDHFAFIFLCWPILMIKTVITHRWWLVNYRLPMGKIIWTKITRRRHIWIKIPWRTKIIHIKVRFPWHMHWWSIWRKHHWFVRIAPLLILVMELLSRRRFWVFRIFRLTSTIDIILSLRLSRKFIELRLFSLMLMTFKLNCFPNINLRLFRLNHLWFRFIL
jgi:hypothetical protein